MDMGAEKRSKALVVSPNRQLRELITTLMEWNYRTCQVENFDLEAVDPARLNLDGFSLLVLDTCCSINQAEVLATLFKKSKGSGHILLLAQAKEEIAVFSEWTCAHSLFRPFGVSEFLDVLQKLMPLELQRGGHAGSDPQPGQVERKPSDNIIRESPKAREFFDELLRYAHSDGTVLLLGESGSGKEIAARLLHDQSPRADGPFVAVNCAAINPTLMESELFGHKRGAFTGADRDRLGLVGRAKGGTLFLDEIVEIPSDLQAKLNRVLENREYHPVGSDDVLQADVRIIAATNADLEKLIATGAFREDLFHRLNVLKLQVPPLRERVEDIPALVELFAFEVARRDGRPIPRFTVEAMEALKQYRWQGNVRELGAVVERIVVRNRGSEIGVSDLPCEYTTTQNRKRELQTVRRKERTPITKDQLLEALRASKGSASGARKLLGCSRQHIYLLKAKFGISRPERHPRGFVI